MNPVFIMQGDFYRLLLKERGLFFTKGQLQMYYDLVYDTLGSRTLGNILQKHFVFTAKIQYLSYSFYLTPLTKGH